MQYLLLIHKNSATDASAAQWNEFFARAKHSGMFQGGSEFGNTQVFGNEEITLSTDQLGGFMRFETSDLKQLQSLLSQHPVVLNGGSIELIEMPEST